jgi:hypothetical protein
VQQLQAVPALMVVADNDTRWSSTYDMISTAVKQKERIDAFVTSTRQLEKDKLSDQDWTDLTDMLMLLEPFKQVTMLGQKKGTRYGSIASTLWAFDMLLDALEKAKAATRARDNGFRRALERSWTLLDRYYHLTDQSTVHIFAMLLDPRMKLEYFERKWPREWVEDAMHKIELFYSQYNSSNDGTADIELNAEGISDNNVNMEETLRPGRLDIESWLYGENNEPEQNELESYLRAGRLKFMNKVELRKFDVHDWWQGMRTVYPMMAAIYFDLCSIPSMSVEPERVFSG